MSGDALKMTVFGLHLRRMRTDARVLSAKIPDLVTLTRKERRATLIAG
jgi:hypothetical protein